MGFGRFLYDFYGFLVGIGEFWCFFWVMVGLSDFFRKQCCIILVNNIGFIGRSKASDQPKGLL